MEKKSKRGFVVAKAEVHKLSKIDLATNTFKATLFIQFVGPGARKDEDFAKSEIVFPIVDGKPTFCPSAGWYVDKLEFCNADSVKILDSAVFFHDDDVIMQIRWEGIFQETYELVDFPFDVQALTMSLSMNCRTSGPLPFEFIIGKQKTGIDMSGFTMDSTFRLREKLLLKTHDVGAHADRLFPTVSISVIAQRKASYWMWNGIVPMAVFSLLALLSWCIPSVKYNSNGELEVIDSQVIHRAHMSLVLVLTIAAYRMAIGGRMPMIAYLTELDRHMLLHSLFVVVNALWARIFCMFLDDVSVGVSKEAILEAHRASFGVFGGIWFLMVFYTTAHQHMLSTNGTPRDALVRTYDEFNTRSRMGVSGHLAHEAATQVRRASVSIANSRRGDDNRVHAEGTSSSTRR